MTAELSANLFSFWAVLVLVLWDKGEYTMLYPFIYFSLLVILLCGNFLSSCGGKVMYI